VSLSSQSPSRSNLLTVLSVAIVAYAKCDMIHEALGHGVACALTNGVTALSISTVAVQTSQQNRWIAAAGSIANVIAGVLLLLLARRRARFDSWGYFLWLLGTLNLLNGTGYLFFSGLTNTGDWSVVIAGWKPDWAWRGALILLGALLYTRAVKMAASALARLRPAAVTDSGEARRLTLPPYIAGGLLLVAGAAMNPIGASLIWVSGVSSGFGAMAGLLIIPRLVGKPGAAASQDKGALGFRALWLVAAALTVAVFVFLIGPGIPLHRG
jgi:hypothetical protein